MKYKSFVIGLLASLLLLTVSNIALLEFFSAKVLKPIDNLLVYTKYAQIRTASAEIIALGDSHVSYGLNINSDRFFNLAYPSDNTVIMYAKLKYYLEQGMKPKILLLQADTHMFTPYREKLDYGQYHKIMDAEIRRDLTDHYGNGRILFDKTLFGLDLYQFRSDISSSIYQLLLRYLREDAFRNENVSILPNGVVRKKGQWIGLSQEEQIESARARLQDQFMGGEAILQPVLMKYYGRILELAREFGIEVVLVHFPESRVYQKYIDHEIAATMEWTFKEIAERHHLVMLDYRSVVESQELFSDSDHLNFDGSIIFGDRVFDDLCQHDETYLTSCSGKMVQ